MLSFYIAPHPDDWLFFYGPDNHAKTTHFIYVTAGDAGRVDGWWQAREKGALAASGGGVLSEERRVIRGHAITKYTQKNSVSYCMRLPDGGLKPESPMAAVDGSTVYSSWEDFCKTLEEIVKIESQGQEAWIHAPEGNPSLNPDDHSDHRATAEAVRSFKKENYRFVSWLCYHIYHCPPNLSPEQIRIKRDCFLAYSNEVERLTRVPPNEREWLCWGRQAYSSAEGCPRKEHFDPAQLSNEEVHYQRCGNIYEQLCIDRLSLTNRMTEKRALLDPVAETLWHLLKVPRTKANLILRLTAAHRKPLSETTHSLLEHLLKLKMICKAPPQRPQLFSLGGETSYPYLSGYTWAHFCTWKMLNADPGSGPVRFNPESVKKGDTVAVDYSCLNDFAARILPRIKEKFVLVTPNYGLDADLPMPARFDFILENENLSAWFVQNIDRAPSEKLIPIPIGIASTHWKHGNTALFDQWIPVSLAKSAKSIFCYINYIPRAERISCTKHFQSIGIPFAKPGTFIGYLKDLSESVFVVSPQGKGLDCHRTWEALLMGCYPIVQSSTLNPLYENLPVVVVQDWSEVTKRFLEEKYQELKSQTWSREKLYAPCWLKKVEKIQALC